MKKIFSFLFVALFSVSMWADASYTVVGSDAAIFGTTYDPSNTANDMTLNGIYVLLKNNVTLAQTTGDWPGYKICQDHGWTKTFPQDGNSYYEVTAAGNYNVVFSFNLSDETYTISLVPTSVEYQTLYFVNKDNWEDVRLYAWAGESNKYMVWPGEKMTKTGNKINEMDIYSYSVPATYNKVIFSNGGSDELPYETWTDATPYYYNGTWYASIDDIDDEVNTKYFITGDANLVGSEKAWHADAIRVKADSYTLENLAAGKVYKLAVSLDGTWDEGKVKKFRNLTEYEAGQYTDNDLNILFSMAEAGNVTVTYTNSVFTVEGNFDLPAVTLKGNRLPEPSKAMTTNTVAQTASATFTLPDEYVGEGKYYSFLVAFSNLDQRCKNYTFNRDYDYTDNILSKGDSLSFRADFAGSYTITWNYATNGVTVVFAPIPVARYYVAGDLTDWSDTTKMARMVESEGVWSAGVTLNASSNYQFKIHRWQGPYQAIYGAHDAVNSMTSSNCTDWKLSSPGENINLATSNAGQYTFKFTPTDNNDLDVVYPNATAIDNTAEDVKAIKRIENGQLVIIKNGVKYNALGAEVK